MCNFGLLTELRCNVHVLLYVLAIEKKEHGHHTMFLKLTSHGNMLWLPIETLENQKFHLIRKQKSRIRERPSAQYHNLYDVNQLFNSCTTLKDCENSSD